MATVGSEHTRLIVLRGDSGSGKTTTALALRPLLGEKTALLHQDYFRREVLVGPAKETRSHDAAILIIGLARQALELGYNVILDGVFNLRDYAAPFEQLFSDHLGATRVYQFDVGFDETVRRHETRPLKDAFGEAELRSWYDGWQPLQFIDEHRVTAEVTVEQLVTKILHDMDT